MRIRAWWALTLAIAPGAVAEGPASTAEPHRKVLVELYSSQGSGESPASAAIFGSLDVVRHGEDHVVAINFHADDRGQPWPDPFADAAATARRRAYNQSSRREDRAGSPLLMFDGRNGLLVPDPAKAKAAVEKALGEAPGVALEAELGGSGRRKVLAIKVEARSSAVAGNDLMVGVAVTEDRVTTKVTSGENAGRTLVEHHVARRLDRKEIRLDRAGSKSLTFPLELPEGADPARSRVVIFVQDRAGGKVHQAESLPWVPAVKHDHAARRPTPSRAVAKLRARQALDLTFGNLPGSILVPGDPDDSATVFCPNCLSTYTIPGVVVQPNGPKNRKDGQPATIPPVPC